MARQRLIILLAPAVAAGLSAAAAFLVDSVPWAAVLAAGAAAIALTVAATLTWGHFDALARLAEVLAGLAAASGQRAPAPILEGAGEEVAAAYRAGLDLHAMRQQERRERASEGAAGRLGQVIGRLPIPILVVTGTGLVSLANGAARRLFDAHSLVPGTSVFDVLVRDDVGTAMAQARAAGHPLDVMIEAVGGRSLAVQVTALDGLEGAILSFASTAWEPGLDHALDLHDRPPPPLPIEPGTPLADLPAVALDCETTGLVPARDHIVAIGAVRLDGARLYRGSMLDLLVRPPVAIPPRAAAIHGIDDATVAAAPPVADQLPAVAEFVRGKVVIGHNIGFDLAVIEAEAARAGLDWVRPPSLCLFRLADALDPGRTDLDLEGLAARLAITITGRHTALGDALLAAEIYQRLLPRLAALGVADWGALTRLAGRSRRAARLQAEAGW